MTHSSQKVAYEQALHLGDIVKSRRAGGTRGETRKRGAGEFLSLAPRVFAARSLAQMGELARRLKAELES